MEYKTRLFINLTAALLIIFIISSIIKYFITTSEIKRNAQKKAIEVSSILAEQFAMEMDDNHQSKIMMPAMNVEPKSIEAFGVHLFKITDSSGKTVIDKKSPDYNDIKKRIKKYNHIFKIHSDNHADIIIMHEHDNDLYFIDVIMSWEMDNKKVRLHSFYNATDFVKEFYNDLKIDIFEIGIIFFLIFIAFYPIILMLNKSLIEKTKTLSRTNIEILKILGSAIAKRDSDTNEHNYRVTLYSIVLGEALKLNKLKMKALIQGAFLHDIGKIGIKDSILLKPGKLTEAEFEEMKKHIEIGKDIVKNSRLLDEAMEVIEYHHEKYNGTGYINGLSRETIPLNARIFAIADVFDALTSERPYKEAFSFEKTKKIMFKESGEHFDPGLLSVFFEIIPNFYRSIYSGGDKTILVKMLKEKVNKYSHE